MLGGALLPSTFDRLTGDDDEPATPAVKREAVRKAKVKEQRRVVSAFPDAAVRAAAKALNAPTRAAQLFIVGFEGGAPRDPFFGRLAKRDWGGVVLDKTNVEGESGAGALAGEVSVVAEGAKHVPPFVAVRQEGGEASAIADIPPAGQRELGKKNKPGTTRDEAKRAAAKLRELNFNMTLAPLADVGAFVGPFEERAFSDDPDRTSRMVSAAVDGYRSGKVISAVGFFPGTGSASQDPVFGPTTVGLSIEELRQRDLKPFAAVAKKAPAIIMSNAAFAGLDGVTPATISRDAIRILRQDLDFRGVIMSDDLVVTAANTGLPIGEVAIAALRAGVDLLYISDEKSQEKALAAVLRAQRPGKPKKKGDKPTPPRLTRAQMDQALNRVLTLKRKQGLIQRNGKPRFPAR